jgi:predicted TIM-barrel fold metal-dependent hydrolase
MGRFGHFVIDADGHGGEPLGWRRRIAARHLAKMREYVAIMRAHYADLPGGGMKIDAASDVVCYASDYYHWDSVFPDSVKMLAERTDLDARALEHLFSANAARLYRLPMA